MADYDERGGMRIGEVLKSTRTRLGLDIRTVEAQTKIRTKYLRALEAEDWEVLPSTAYTKGFLRTYAQLLGLDADAVVDEFRRQVEAAQRPAYPVGGEPVLERRRRLGDSPEGPRVVPVLAVAVAVVAAFLLVLGLTGGSGDDEDDRAERREARQAAQQARREARREGQGRAPGPVRLRLVINANVRVCLIGDGRRPLIDGQVLPAGSEETFRAGRFRLAFPSGYDGQQFRLFVDGERVRLPQIGEPAAFRIRGVNRVRRAPEPGPGCP